MADIIKVVDMYKKAKTAKDNTEIFLNEMKNINRIVSREIVVSGLAMTGKKALEAATPVDTGKTASSWDYEISDDGAGRLTIDWTNDNIVDGVNVAVILQYGHGTRNGGYVEGRDYINPALRPIMDMMAERMWNAVVRV